MKNLYLILLLFACFSCELFNKEEEEEKGLLLKKIWYSDVNYTEFIYNENNDVSKMIVNGNVFNVITKNGLVDKVIRSNYDTLHYFYDSRNRIIKLTDPGIAYEARIFYNQDNKERAVIYDTDNGDYIDPALIYYTYENNNLVKNRYVDKNGEIISNYSSYDTNPNPFLYSSQALILTYGDFSANNPGRLLTVAGNSESTSDYVYEYNSEGYPTKRIRISEGDTIYVYKYEYIR